MDKVTAGTDPPRVSRVIQLIKDIRDRTEGNNRQKEKDEVEARNKDDNFACYIFMTSNNIELISEQDESYIERGGIKMAAGQPTNNTPTPTTTPKAVPTNTITAPTAAPALNPAPATKSAHPKKAKKSPLDVTLDNLDKQIKDLMKLIKEGKSKEAAVILEKAPEKMAELTDIVNLMIQVCEIQPPKPNGTNSVKEELEKMLSVVKPKAKEKFFSKFKRFIGE
jgi:hypothetical protein